MLVLALLITPAAAASQLARRLPAIIGLSVLFAVISSVVGFYASYYANVASGSAVVLSLTVIFAITFSVNALRRKFS